MDGIQVGLSPGRSKAAKVFMTIFLSGFAIQFLLVATGISTGYASTNTARQRPPAQPVILSVSPIAIASDESLAWLREQLLFYDVLTASEGLVHATHPQTSLCSVMIFDSAAGAPSGWLCFGDNGMYRSPDVQFPIEMQLAGQTIAGN